eukprot:CAMPEP_0196769226 /NCGR_PEP_ID=MMETSP1104-20130614/410_1 /TAXON_ID=33652 /ORGANISM="Cafeteria sp., Strain Caron Lab Isolate" /LENGTH=1058 /DNA_ID=CAMNT_0042139311 /DNA_START=186 /DNA_END=3362 /DNA_ORIENTATION=-
MSKTAIAAHALSVEDVCQQMKTDPDAGLTSEEARKRLAEYGPNELEKEEKTPLWKLVLEQFDDLLVKILLVSAVFSFVVVLIEEGADAGLSAFVEPGVIMLILIINAIVGVWQESNAENALEALKQMQPVHAHCYRDGKLHPEMLASELVPGDVVEVRVGDKVPADMRILELNTVTLTVEQAALTGESKTVQKSEEEVDEDVDIAGKTNMLFSSTTVTTGSARCCVVSTGMRTEIGQIQDAVTKAKEEEEKTPLGQKIDEFGEKLSYVIGFICLLVWAMNYHHFFDPAFDAWWKGCIYYLKIAVALGVAAIPEGLPAVITLCLALGTRKMVKRNAIVRKLPSVETLGCTTVICSDKTGTLTTNEMVVKRFFCMGDTASSLRTHEVSGNSYAPEGEIDGWAGMEEEDGAMRRLAQVASLCNGAQVTYHDGRYQRVGEPTEAALKVLVEKMGVPGVDREELTLEQRARYANDHWAQGYAKVATLEFSRDRKSMSVICAPSDARSSSSRRSGAYNLRRRSSVGGAAATGNVLFCKGAPESVMERCTHVLLGNGEVVPLDAKSHAAVMGQVRDMSAEALRCLAFAVKTDLGELADYDGSTHPAHQLLADPGNYASVEQGMTFVGVAAIRDPPRDSVRPSLELCRDAGIRVFMITGDNKLTAESIARDIGLFAPDEDVSRKSFTGRDFFALPHEEQLEVLSGIGARVFSRAEPIHKQKLVRLLKEEGEVVAMTGDGVNDAPALKLADIGVAMGITGTEVAKEASDMVLADDNFATIVAAVEEGRSIYQNMKAFIRYLISSNIGEVASIFLTAALGMPEGLIPVQLLWVNLVTDGPPATALGFNPPEPDIMSRPPRSKDDALITSWVFFRYMVIGLYVGFATVGIFAYWYIVYDWAGDGHTLITWHQLSNWGKCPQWENFAVADFGGMSFQENPCEYFEAGKIKASTLSLSVLVVIEMLNALNALSEDASLLQMPPWVNPWLLVAMGFSIGLHFVILYIPWLATIFRVVPLTLNDWILVMAFSTPVILVDEVLKFVGRIKLRQELAVRRQEMAHAEEVEHEKFD